MEKLYSSLLLLSIDFLVVVQDSSKAELAFGVALWYSEGMQPFPEYVLQLRKDVRLLRVDKDRLTRAHRTQKQKAERFQEQLQDKEHRIKELEK